MPSNDEILASFDANELIGSTRVLGGGDDTREYGAQCVAFETLRHLIDAGLTAEDYNNMSDEQWQDTITASVAAARSYATSPVAVLLSHERDAAANTGGNYFEHSYDGIMAGVGADDRVWFRKNTGLE